MQAMIQKEAHTYAKWASAHHQTAVFNQHAAEWHRIRAKEVDSWPVYVQTFAARTHITAMVTESLMRRDGLVGPSDVRGMIGRTVLVRVTR